MLRILPAIILMLVMFFCANAQKIDSLTEVIYNAKTDTTRINALLALGDEHLYANVDSAMFYYEKARVQSEKSGYVRGTVLYLLSRQYIMCIQGQFDSAMVLCVKARELADQINDRSREASAIANMGSIHLYKGNKLKAIEYYLEAMKRFEQIGDKRRLPSLYTNIAINYERLKQYEPALLYGKKAIELGRQGSDREALGLALNNQSVTLIASGKPREALPLLEEALEIAKQLNAKRLRLSVLINLAGSLEDEIRDKEKFRSYIEEALRLSRALDEKVGQAISLRCLGSYYFVEGDLATAKRFTKEALELTRQYDNPEEEVKALSLLSYISATAREMSEHSKYKKEEQQLRDSLVNKDLITAVRDIEAKYESDKKEAKIASLSKEKEMQSYVMLEQSRLNAGLVGLVIILIISGALLYRNYIQRQQLQQQTIIALQTERQLVATNAVLQGQEGERKRLAKDLHDGLGGMLSGAKFTFDAMRDNVLMTAESQKAFSRGMDLLETSIHELRRVAHNMMPESLVKTGLWQAVKDMCEDYRRDDLNIIYQQYGLENVHLSPTVSITVYRIIQELVNNSMKHAGGSQIIVQLSLHNDRLQITVEDDGVGTSRETLEKSNGMGWSNIRSRVEYLNGNIDIQSQQRKGTSITVSLPAEYMQA